MLAPSIAAAVAAVRRLLLGAAYAAFVAMVTASWMTARPASAEVPPGSALGEPVPDAEPSDSEIDAAGDPDGPIYGPPPPQEAQPEPGELAGEAERGEPRSKGKELRGRLNLNEARKEELELLPGIGDAISGRILAWRQRHGRFYRVKDLRRVRGIGPKTLENLRPYLTIIGPTTLRKGD